jgi:hypothetical protein
MWITNINTCSTLLVITQLQHTCQKNQIKLIRILNACEILYILGLSYMTVGHVTW